MKPKHQRLLFVTVSIIFLCVGGLFAMQSFRQNLVFFYSPSDMEAQVIDNNKTIRIGGLVKTGTIQHGEGDSINFIVTDGNADINVSYIGILPNLFRDGQGCIAEGKMLAPGKFSAQKILAKHDEKYIPKEVVDALKRSGNWHGDEK